MTLSEEVLGVRSWCGADVLVHRTYVRYSIPSCVFIRISVCGARTGLSSSSNSITGVMQELDVPDEGAVDCLGCLAGSLVNDAIVDRRSA